MQFDPAAMATFYESEMAVRRERPLTPERQRLLRTGTDHLRHRPDVRSVLEVGCGAGRDGQELAAAVDRYIGVDTSLAGVRICRERGLHACVASATALPFNSDTFDAAWSMSTLMHLPDVQFTDAILELRRVCRAGTVVMVGLWGGDAERAFVDSRGRYFHHRTDDQVCRALSLLGTVASFTTWDRWDDGGHYQCASVLVS